LRRLGFLLLLSSIAPLASAQYTTYQIYVNDAAIPAGVRGFASGGVVNDPPAGSAVPFNICFYTGFGSTAPIVPTGYVNQGDYATFNYAIPISTIQDVPNTSFSKGVFTAVVYTVPTSFKSCTGASQSLGNSANVTLNYPIVSGVSLPAVPAQNPALSTRLPSSLAIFGSYFISMRGSNPHSPSTVDFVSSNTVPATDRFVSSGSLVSTIPATLPTTEKPLSVKVCNTAEYSYCGSSPTIKVLPLQSDFGTLTATTATTPAQPVTLAASFGPATPTVAGAPSGLVTFYDGSTALGSAPLVLDTTAAFVAAPARSFTVSTAPIQPIVADFNTDGIPDILVVDPGTATQAASLHLLLGSVPSGSFAPDVPISVLSDGSSFQILSAAVADFNADGIPDIALLAVDTSSAASQPVLYTLLGNGDGSFQNGFIAYSASALYSNTRIAAGDFNHDGKADILLAGALRSDGTTGLQPLFGDGTGNFTAGPVTLASAAPGAGFKLAVADFNGDGYPDIAILNGAAASGSVDASIELYENDGTAAFLAPVRVQTDATASASFLVASLGPGQPPAILVTSSASNPGVAVALNQSTTAQIAFAAASQTTGVPGLSQAVAADFNGDGLLDLAVYDGTSIHVLNGAGDGTFSAVDTGLSFAPPANSILIAASDQNGDTYADLLLLTAGTPAANSIPLGLTAYVTAGTSTAALQNLSFNAGSHTLTASTNGTYQILGTTATGSLVSTAITPMVAIAALSSTPASYGHPPTLVATIPDPTATGTVSFMNGSLLLGMAPLVDGSAAVATFTPVNLPAGNYDFVAVYSGDLNHTAAASAPLAVQVLPVQATISWVPNPATIAYGTALSAAQLDATATGVSGTTVAGSFTYSIAAGTVLSAGQHTISATFTPSDANYTAATASQTITVSQATPIVAWTPAVSAITYGTPLSAAQLDATSTTPGTFVYTPAPGTLLTAGTQTLKAVFTPTDSTDFNSVTATTSIAVNAATPTLTWTPNPATIIYGTGLAAAQLDAAASIPGTFAYTPAAGTVLTVGPQTITAVFTPADTADYTSATTTATIAVTQATPVISWATPPGILPGTALSAAQLNATVTGANGSALPGAFVYMPPLGTVLPSGIQRLSVVFTPTDTADYTSASASVPIAVEVFSLASLSSTVAVLGDPAKTITVTGTGFAATAVVQMGTTAIPTTFVSSTTLTAVIPASDFQTVQTIQLSVVDPVLNLSSAPVPFYVVAPIASVLFAGPNATVPAAQTSVNFQLTNPYPVDLAANFGLTFTPAAGLPADPSVMFSNGGDSYTVVIPANTTASPTVQFQTGTVAGTATVSLSMVAGGTNVTPPSVQPINIASPFTVPGITSVSASASGETLTVTVRGFSNNRQMNQAKFHFTPVAGRSIATPDVTLNVDSIFATWYADSASGQYGSEFTYTQTFNLTSDASVVGEVTVTLANSLGTSPEANTP